MIAKLGTMGLCHPAADTTAKFSTDRQPHGSRTKRSAALAQVGPRYFIHRRTWHRRVLSAAHASAGQ